MDREVLKMIAHIDQTREELRAMLVAMAPEDRTRLFRACATGRLSDMDEREHLLVGMLAAMSICDLLQGGIDRPEAEA